MVMVTSANLRNIMFPILSGLHPWTFLLILGITLFPCVPVCLADYSGLLLNTLKSQFTFACENEIMSIKCPESTKITIESANYGRQVPSRDMCPYKWSTIGAYQLHDFITENTNCRSENSLEPVVTLCQDRIKCKLRVESELFGDDPCPGTTKYLDVTYKCRPSEFQNVVKCEDSHLHLNCRDNTVLAIDSAMFGRTHQGTIECPSYTMQEVDCQSSGAYEELLERCHGRKHCAVKASTRVFGEPCLPGTYKYLKVVYSCVSKNIFRKPRKYINYPDQPSKTPDPTANYIEAESERDEISVYSHDMYNTEHPNYSNNIYDGKGDNSIYSGEDYVTLLFPNSSNSTTTNRTSTDDNDKVGLLTSILSALGYISANKETVILYFIVGCLVGTVFTLTWCACRIKLHNRQLKKKIRGTGIPPQGDGTDGDTRNNGIMEMVRQENRIDIDEIWNSPLPPSITSRETETDERQENNTDNGLGTSNDDNNSHANTRSLTIPRNGLSTSQSLVTGNGLGLMLDGIDLSDLWNANTLPGSRNLNSYFP